MMTTKPGSGWRGLPLGSVAPRSRWPPSGRQRLPEWASARSVCGGWERRQSEPTKLAVLAESPAHPEYYSAGTRELKDGRDCARPRHPWRALAREPAEATGCRRSTTLAMSNSRGLTALKKSPPRCEKTVARGRTTSARRSHSPDRRRARHDAPKMHGRGVRKEGRPRRRAQGHDGAALSRWQRSSGDFKSALELRSTDTDSEHNAEWSTHREAGRSARPCQRHGGQDGPNGGQAEDARPEPQGRTCRREPPAKTMRTRICRMAHGLAKRRGLPRRARR